MVFLGMDIELSRESDILLSRKGFIGRLREADCAEIIWERSYGRVKMF